MVRGTFTLAAVVGLGVLFNPAGNDAQAGPAQGQSMTQYLNAVFPQDNHCIPTAKFNALMDQGTYQEQFSSWKVPGAVDMTGTKITADDAGKVTERVVLGPQGERWAQFQDLLDGERSCVVQRGTNPDVLDFKEDPKAQFAYSMNKLDDWSNEQLQQKTKAKCHELVHERGVMEGCANSFGMKDMFLNEQGDENGLAFRGIVRYDYDKDGRIEGNEWQLNEVFVHYGGAAGQMASYMDTTPGGIGIKNLPQLEFEYHPDVRDALRSPQVAAE